MSVKLAATVAAMLAFAGVVLAYGEHTARGGGASWGPLSVTVGPPNRMLYPGVTATMPYEIRNTTSRTQRLQGTTVTVRSDGAGVYDTNTTEFRGACAATWFEIGGNALAAPAGGADVEPGASVHGSFDITFRDAPVNQDACQGTAVAVDVETT